MNQLITYVINFKEQSKIKKFKTNKFKDKLNNNKKSENKSDKNDEKSNSKNSNSNSTITLMLKNSKKNTLTDKNCTYCDSSFHNIDKCKLNNPTT